MTMEEAEVCISFLKLEGSIIALKQIGHEKLLSFHGTWPGFYFNPLNELNASQKKKEKEKKNLGATIWKASFDTGKGVQY